MNNLANEEILKKSVRNDMLKQDMPMLYGNIMAAMNTVRDEATIDKINDIRELIESTQEYIRILGMEIKSAATIAMAHGWRSDLHEEGNKQRKRMNYIVDKIVDDLGAKKE